LLCASQRDDHCGARPGRNAQDNVEIAHNFMMLEEARSVPPASPAG
jgi:hypothetical protein